MGTETGSPQGNAYQDIFLVSHQSLVRTSRRMGQRYEGKSPAIKGMGGVNHFDLTQDVFRRVVERGIKLAYRLTTLTMGFFAALLSEGSMTEEYCV